MKPMGTIPDGYLANAQGQLLIGGHPAEDLVSQVGSTPVFVYDFGLIKNRIAHFRNVMPAGLNLHYAMKANPMPELLAEIADLVDGIDVASAGEMALALPHAKHISFAGPGKRDAELEAAIRAQVVINLESEGEAQRALTIADRLGVVPRLAVRVNPSFDLKGSGMRMGGGAKPFGLDAERVPELVKALISAGADWFGFHIFAGSQALDAAAIAETQANTIALAADLAEQAGAAPHHVNIGGGLGIPYFPGEKPVDLALISEKLADVLEKRPKILSGTVFAMEMGRYLVGEAGVYLCRIVDRKVSHGEIFLVTDGGLHHQLAASGNFGTVVRRNYPLAIASKFGREPDETASVVGCLCTPLDRLGDQVALPQAEVGDLVAVFMAGAYGASASPSRFLGHPDPREILVNK
jgi:diaminopimelate decarboxylase